MAGSKFQYVEFLDTTEQLIRAGQIQNAARRLRQLNLARVPEPYHLRIANLARRSGQPAIVFRVLHDARHSLRRKASAGELSEYAVALTLNGGVSEALRIMETVDLTEHAFAYLAKAWCHFESWEYEQSVPLLEKYLRSEEDAYMKMAGRVNLAEAYVFTGDHRKALKLLTKTIDDTERTKNVRLLANTLHVRAQLYFATGNLAKSDQDLKRALQLFGGAGSSDALLIHRQIAINAAHRSQDPKPLRKFRDMAIAARAWESVREAEFQLLSLRFNEKAFERLYYGTPYLGYRRRMEVQFARKPQCDRILWGQGGGRLSLGKESQLSKQNLALIDVLLRDFYAPLSIGGLFAGLFPDEKYDHFSSPDRVHQIIKRVRQLLKTESIPLEIRCEEGQFSLHQTSAFTVVIPIELRRDPVRLSPIEQLRRAMPGEFGAKEAREVLGIPKATLTRYLESAVESGEIVRSGAGRATKYSFKSNRES